MESETRVWIAARKRKRGPPSYHLRWIDLEAGKWRSRKVYGDRKRAEREAAQLEAELHAGTYRVIKPVAWQAFVDEHCEKLPGAANAAEARRTLEEFGKLEGVGAPRAATFAKLESYVQKLRAEGNSTATVNKKLRYLRAAFNKAVKRGYLAANPMRDWEWTREEEPVPRIITPAEEAALLQAAEDLFGYQWRAFIAIGLATGGRRSELLGLSWDRVTLDGNEPRIHFAETKGKRDRLIPITPETVDILRRLKASTQVAGGPFVALAADLDDQWAKLLQAAKVVDVQPHDMRRTFVTRLIRAGVPVPTVQKLAGHQSITTTLRYYNWTSQEDMKNGIEKLRKTQATG